MLRRAPYTPVPPRQARRFVAIRALSLLQSVPVKLTAPARKQILISTSVDKYIPTYNVNVVVVGTERDAKPQELNFERPFSQWFDEAGLFVTPPFQQAFASEVAVIGRQDPKRVKTKSQEMFDENPELLDAVMAANAEGASTSTETGGKKGGKRRKA
jgi:signal peptidase complex subunit 2